MTPINRQIPMRPLGRSGMQVSLLGLGTVKLGRNESVKYPDSFKLPDDDSVRQLLTCAQELGINLLDTAPAYGESEARLGKLLQGQRHDWLICSKVGEDFADGRSHHDFTPEAVQASVERSLQRLRTDHLDVVLIHSDGNDLEILESLGTLECLNDLKAMGLIRATGISHKTIAGAERAIALRCDVIMATLNLQQQDEVGVISAAAEAGCGVLVKKAMASGHAGADSLRFAASQTGVSSVVVGTINIEHLRSNARAIAELALPD